MKHFLLLLLCFFLNNYLYSQANQYISTNLLYGRMIESHPEYASRGSAYFLEYSYSRETFGNSYWHKALNYPEIGFSFLYGNAGEKNILGESLSLATSLTFTYKKWKNVEFSGKYLLGFSYHTKTFNRIENPINKIISTRITDITYASLLLSVNISERWKTWGGVTVIHCSNAHYKIPNGSSNYFLLQVGIKYRTNQLKNIQKSENIFLSEHKWHFATNISLGIHEFGLATTPTNGAKYPIYLFSTYFLKRYSNVKAFHLGLFFAYYTSFYDYMRFKNLSNTNLAFKKSFVVAPFLGYEVLLGKFSWVFKVGVKIYDPFFKELNDIQDTKRGINVFLKEIICTRFGVQYYFSNISQNFHYKPYIGILVKTNSIQADFLELTTGFVF